MPVTAKPKPATLPLTPEGRRLLLALLEWAVGRGYPFGEFERELLRRLRGE